MGILFLVVPFLVGLFSPSRVVAGIPLSGYLGGMALSWALPGNSLDDYTYDIGWYGFLLYFVFMYSFVMCFAIALGRGIR